MGTLVSAQKTITSTTGNIADKTAHSGMNMINGVSSAMGDSASYIANGAHNSADFVTKGVTNGAAYTASTMSDGAHYILSGISNGVSSTKDSIGKTINNISHMMAIPTQKISEALSTLPQKFTESSPHINTALYLYEHAPIFMNKGLDFIFSPPQNEPQKPLLKPLPDAQMVLGDELKIVDTPAPETLNAIETAASVAIPEAQELEAEQPANVDANGVPYKYEITQDEVITEAVLVPKEKTIISSSRDGKIKAIYFDNGDRFQKGDTLLEYECADLQAEKSATKTEKKFALHKNVVTKRLYDLGLSSDLDKLEAQLDQNVSQAKDISTQIRLQGCVIKATYNGRVIKRIANPNEYTRTDRVLLEVASEGTLDAEFLVPSIWLRWINIDAPIEITLHETGAKYSGKIERIYGEVDPVSQSIQVRASLDDYDTPLLPGMSGQMRINAQDIRTAGIRGFLDIR